MRRVGRAALGLIGVVIVIPVIVLLPLFWLESRLPPEAGVERVLAPTMALTLIALVLVALMNVVGAGVQGLRAVGPRSRQHRDSPERAGRGAVALGPISALLPL